MKPCKVCGKELADDATICPNCGHHMSILVNWADKLGVAAFIFSVLAWLFTGASTLSSFVAFLMLIHRLGLLVMGIISVDFATHKVVEIVAIVFASLSLLLLGVHVFILRFAFS